MPPKYRGSMFSDSVEMFSESGGVVSGVFTTNTNAVAMQRIADNKFFNSFFINNFPFMIRFAAIGGIL